MVSSKLVYLDHSSWPAIRLLFKDARYQLGLSIWSLLALAGARDLTQRASRISLIEACKPVWLLDHVYVRKQEVKRFLWPRSFNTPPPDLAFVTRYLSEAEAVYAGSKTRLGLTISTLVNDLARGSCRPEGPVTIQPLPSVLILTQRCARPPSQLRLRRCRLAQDVGNALRVCAPYFRIESWMIVFSVRLLA
jgi:hypothetical protein